MSVADYGSKRYADVSRRLTEREPTLIPHQTAILITTWVRCPFVDVDSIGQQDPDTVDPRNALALARTNWIHQQYNIVSNSNRQNYVLQA